MILNNLPVKYIYLGNHNVNKVFKGEVLVWGGGSSYSNIYYVSSDGKIVVPITGSGEPLTLSNIYSEGRGSILFDGSLSRIIAYKFRDCGTLRSIELPDTVTTVGDNAFQNCTGLTEVDFYNVTNYGDNVFRGCTNLERAALNCRVISEGMFYGCSKLSYVGRMWAVESIREDAFRGCTSLKSIDLSRISGYISNSAFYGSGLETVFIPSSVTRIGDTAFYGCESLTSADIQANTEFIPFGAFARCSRLESVTFPAELKIIEQYAFEYSGLRSVGFPKTFSKIEDMAFHSCVNLLNVVFPLGLTEIGNNAFEGCESLSNIEYQGTKREWASITKGSRWAAGVNTDVVRCIDGNVEI